MRLGRVGNPLLAGPHRRQPWRGFLLLLDLSLTVRKVENYSWGHILTVRGVCLAVLWGLPWCPYYLLTQSGTGSSGHGE